MSDATLALVGTQFECSVVERSAEAQAVDAEQFQIASSHLVEAEIAATACTPDCFAYERGVRSWERRTSMSARSARSLPARFGRSFSNLASRSSMRSSSGAVERARRNTEGENTAAGNLQRRRQRWIDKTQTQVEEPRRDHAHARAYAYPAPALTPPSGRPPPPLSVLQPALTVGNLTSPRKTVGSSHPGPSRVMPERNSSASSSGGRNNFFVPPLLSRAKCKSSIFWDGHLRGKGGKGGGGRPTSHASRSAPEGSSGSLSPRAAASLPRGKGGNWSGATCGAHGQTSSGFGSTLRRFVRCAFSSSLLHSSAATAAAAAEHGEDTAATERDVCTLMPLARHPKPEP